MATARSGRNTQSIKSLIAGGFDFWGESMRSLLPQAMQQRLIVGQEQLIVFVNGEHIAVQQNINGNVTELGQFHHLGDRVDEALIKLVKKHRTRDKSLLLVVPDDMVLSKPVDLPVAVANNLHQTLQYEMGKHTPFPKEDVLFDVVIEHRRAAIIQSRLYLLHRQQVFPILAAFQQHKIIFDQLCASNQQDINLLPYVLRRKTAIIPYKRNWFFALFLLLLILLGLALPLYFKRDAAIQLQNQLAQLEPQALGEGELWEQRDVGEQTVLDFIASYPLPFTQVYETLSRLMPDSDWVSQFDFQNGNVTIRGESRNVAKLIDKINANPLFGNARLASSITKSRERPDNEIFHIAFAVITQREANQ